MVQLCQLLEFTCHVDISREHLVELECVISESEVHTTLDYILMNVEVASMMLSCSTHCMDDLNTLDHLPLTARLAYVPCPQGNVQKGQVQPRINWDRARRTGEIDDYISEVQSRWPLF